jgi:hypothetical protein
MAERLIETLKVRPFCDGPEVGDLSPEQQAALHVFQHEVLAAYYRVCEKVPAAAVNRVISGRLTKAAA